MRKRHPSSATVPSLFFLLLLAAIVTTPAHAQFQRVYGGANTEAGRGGVQQTFDGGFITAGESNSGGMGYDIYVVKTNSLGSITWSYRYNIGQNDYGRHIQQTSDTGYIVTGYTRDSSNCCAQDNLFLMKLNPFGAVQWVKTYGGTGDEQGWCVRQLGNGGYIVAGRSNSFGQGDYDGYLLRTDAGGGLIWGRVYGSDQMDYFLSCIQDSATTDIFAVGSTLDSTQDSTQQGLAVRVRLQDGAIQWSNTYGNEGTEVFRSVRRLSGQQGDLIIAGLSTSLTESSSGLLMQLSPAGNVVGSMLYNPVGGLKQWDEFADAVEINTGTIGVVGVFTNSPGGYGSFDMVVLEVSLWNMGVNQSWLFGGGGNDQGVSIGKVGPSGPKLIAAGLTTSFGNAQQLFLVETNAFVPSLCERELSIDTLNPNFRDLAIELPTSRVLMSCMSFATAALDMNPSDSVCSGNSDSLVAPPIEGEKIDSIPDTHQGMLSNVDDAASTRLDVAAIASFPNPVRSGEPFTISYQSMLRSTATIEIVSMTGKVIRTMETEQRAGENSVTVSTEGWGVGSYVVRIAVDGRTDSRRVVVSER